MSATWLDRCHPLKRTGEFHPFVNRATLHHTLERVASQFGDARGDEFAAYGAQRRLGGWHVRRWGRGTRPPPLDQDLEARALCAYLNDTVGAEHGGWWFVALGEWVGSCAILLDASGEPMAGGYDMLLALWGDDKIDKPFVVDWPHLHRRGFPVPAEMAESCSKAWLRYREHVRQLEIGPREMVDKAIAWPA